MTSLTKVRTYLSLVGAVLAMNALTGCPDKGDDNFYTVIQGNPKETDGMGVDTAVGGLGDANVQASLLQINQDAGASSEIPRDNVTDGKDGTYTVPVNAAALAGSAGASTADQQQVSALSTTLTTVSGKARFALEVAGGPFGTETVDVDLTVAVGGFVFIKVNIQRSGTTQLAVVVFDRSRRVRSGAIAFTVKAIPEAPPSLLLATAGRVVATRASTGTSTSVTVSGGHIQAANRPVTVSVRNKNGADAGSYTPFADANGDFSVSITLNAADNKADTTEIFTYEASYTKNVSGSEVPSLASKGQVSLFLLGTTSTQPTISFGGASSITLDPFNTSPSLAFTVSSSAAAVVLTAKNATQGSRQVFEQSVTSGSTTVTFALTLADGETQLEAYSYATTTAGIRVPSTTISGTATITSAKGNTAPQLLVDPTPSTIYVSATGGGPYATLSPNNELTVRGSATAGSEVRVYFPGRLTTTAGYGDNDSQSTASQANWSDEAVLNAVNRSTAGGTLSATSGSSTLAITTANATASAAGNGTSTESAPYFSFTLSASQTNFAFELVLDHAGATYAAGNNNTASAAGNGPVVNPTTAGDNADGDSKTVFSIVALDPSTGLDSDNVTRTVEIAAATTPALTSQTSGATGLLYSFTGTPNELGTETSSGSKVYTSTETGKLGYAYAPTTPATTATASSGTTDWWDVTHTGIVEVKLSGSANVTSDTALKGGTVIVRVDTRVPDSAFANDVLTANKGPVASGTYTGTVDTAGAIAATFKVSEGYSAIGVILLDTNGISATVGVSRAASIRHSTIYGSPSSSAIILHDIRYDNLATNNATLIPRRP